MELERILTRAIQGVQQGHEDAFQEMVRGLWPLATFFMLGAGVGVHGEEAERLVAKWAMTVTSEAYKAMPPYLEWVERQLEELVHHDFFRDAARLQSGIMCRLQSLPPGVRAHAVTRAGQRVTGDLVLSVPAGDRAWFAVGDVTGHGTAAAVYSALVLHLLQNAKAEAELQRESHPLLAAALVVNREILRYKVGNVALPIIMGLVDASTRTVEVLNCGSTAKPFLLRDHHAIEVGSGGPPLGYLPNPALELWEYTWTGGETLVLPTDGIVEQCNSAGVQYSNSALAEHLQTIHERDPEMVTRRIFEALDTFSHGVRRGDDQSVLVIALG